MKFNFIYLFLICIVLSSSAQTDTTGKKHKLIFQAPSDTNLLFTGTRISEKDVDDESAKMVIGGYVSAYYGHYTDETNNGGFVQFPTMAARNDQFGLNLAQISMDYRSKRVRSNVTFHYGDIAESTWPTTFKMVQDAHVGVKFAKGLWFDAGFFKTHIGLESIQPRENVTSSMAVLTFFEPYYLSGAKLTYEVNSKLSLQLNAFNSYNGFIENNKNKVLGFAAVYDVNSNISITYNLMTCDETPDSIHTKHERIYNNIYATFKFNKLSFGLEANYGTQTHTLKSDTTKTAMMYSGLAVVHYQFLKKVAAYSRLEYYSDPSKILTGTVSTGNYIMGTTAGIEYKPLKNVALSCEGRILQCDDYIFKEGNFHTNQRYEIIGCLDIWF